VYGRFQYRGELPSCWAAPRPSASRGSAPCVRGDGKQPMDWTTYADTARYTAEVVDDRSVPSKLCIAGDVLDFDGIVQAYEMGSGKKLRVERLGSLADLHAYRAGADVSDPRKGHRHEERQEHHLASRRAFEPRSERNERRDHRRHGRTGSGARSLHGVARSERRRRRSRIPRQRRSRDPVHPRGSRLDERSEAARRDVAGGHARRPRLHHGHLRGNQTSRDGGGHRARHGRELPEPAGRPARGRVATGHEPAGRTTQAARVRHGIPGHGSRRQPRRPQLREVVQRHVHTHEHRRRQRSALSSTPRSAIRT